MVTIEKGEGIRYKPQEFYLLKNKDLLKTSY
jgi:hypothetical protein